MFTGIVKGLCPVKAVKKQKDFLQYAVKLPKELLKGLKQGASVSIDGVCQTVVKVEKDQVWFDAISETLKKTTLKSLQVDQQVNVERAATFKDEIGGHLLSGHIFGTAEIVKVKKQGNTCIMTFQAPTAWMKYLFPKGYIAIDGASLTLVDVEREKGIFTVHLIPETLRLTTLGFKKAGHAVNIELDSHTQVIVDTVERIHQANNK